MKIQFTSKAWEEYLYWQQTDKKILRKVNDLIQLVVKDPSSRTGKREVLRHPCAGYWSLRITDRHRLVYKAESDRLVIVQVR